jgi:glucose/arabinose dehydrogenase/PKD repeat protein
MARGYLSRTLVATALFIGAQVVVESSLPQGQASAATPTFVQAKANEVTSGTTNRVAFTSANGVGNLIVAYVVWNNGGTASVTDTRGNAYSTVAPATKWNNNAWSSQVFYAKNVAAGANTVTATFGTAINSFGILYVHEYSGMDKTAPVDVTKSAVGTTTAMSSGTATTTSPTDLIFGAGASVNNINQPGSGFTTRSTAYGNRTEDRTVTVAGSYAATASQNGSGWVMHMVAFKAAASDTTAPSVPTGLAASPVSSSQINLSWTTSTDNVGVAGYKVYRNGTLVGTPGTTLFQDTGLTAGTTYSYTVAAYDGAGNTSAQSTAVSATTLTSPPDNTPPTVSLTSPTAGSTVQGAVTLSASASDDVGVAGVQFLLDGANLGVEDPTSPYSISWDTTAVSNGTHVVGARARDGASHLTTSSPVTITVNNPSAPPGLLAGYAFDEGTGTTAADASGHSLTGTLTNGATWMPAHFGQGVRLDGNDDYVNLNNPSSLQFTGSMTISSWIYSSAFPGDDAAIVSKRTSNGYQLDTTIDTGPRVVSFKLTNSSGGDMFRYGATTLQVNTWYFVTGVYDAASQSLNVYVNGQLDNGPLVGTITSTQQNSAGNVLVGQRSGGGFNFVGGIDNVRLYGRALTPSEIQADMNAPLGSGGSSDPTPPTVSITAPAAGTQVSNIVTVTANAADNVGVVGVQFYVDGVSNGPEDTTSPYALTWDTRTTPNGSHTLTARARDAAGNSTVSSGVTVNVANTNYFQNEILATNFNLPTSMKFLPDGRLLITELAGKIRVVPPPYTTPDPTPFLQLTNIGSAGVQQGIFDLALDPNFATNHYYYIFYTLGSPNVDRLSRFTANSTLTGTIAGSEFVFYQDPQIANAEHHGGAIMFGNDGKLYFTTGEHFDAAAAQDLSSPRGKIHRLNLDGTVPTDNPFYDGNGPHWDSIWAYGLRNPYRAFYDAPSGRMFIGDVGGNDYSTAKEEVEIGARGANYGWPNYEGPCPAPACTSPLNWWAHNGRDSAVTGGFVYHGSVFPAGYDGSYFFADYTQNWIRRLTLDANGNLTGVFNFEPMDGSVDGPYGDIVYLVEGPDGAVYYLDLGYSDISGTYGISKLRRIKYVQSNQAPVVAASANVTSGPAPLSVNFSSAGSSDPEGVQLTYNWNFGDNVTSTAANPTHVYTAAGTYSARLTVSDGVNSSTSSPITISVGNRPVASITSPVDGTFFRAADVISFSGNATDTEDGTLPASAFTWNIDFLHEGHVHPGTPITGVKSGTFQIPTTGHDFSGLTRYRITLTVTDSTGLVDTKSVIIWPTKVNLTFTTAPAGLTLYLDGIAKTTPFVYDTLVGFIHTIEARNQSANGNNYTFASWSDGGTQTHALTVPASNASYTATYTSSPIAAGPITFKQVNSATPQTSQTSVGVGFGAAQTAGNLNVVVVGWNDITSNVISVTDSSGNVYQAAAPVTRSSSTSQAIYFAKNIAANANNTVTVAFNTAASYVDLRILEYSGIDAVNPLDQTASAVGSSATANSGNVTTTAANELVFGAGTTTDAFSGGGSGFTTRVITTPDADIAEDRIVSTTGSYGATASQGGGTWVMQVVTFRGAAQ